MKMKRIVKVKSNVKAGCEVTLGEKTLIVGRNGTGKSTIVNAIELATTGAASDMRGRDVVRDEKALLSLAPNRADEAYAEVFFDDGTSAIWSTKREGARAKKANHIFPKDVDPERALPLRALREATLGSVETARKFFLLHAVGAVTRKDVLARLPQGLHAYYGEAIKSATGLTEVDRLLFALESAKKKMREKRAEAKTQAETAIESGRGLPSPPTEADLAAHRQRAQVARDMLERAAAAAAREVAQLDFRTRLENATLLKRAAEEKRDKAQARLNAIEVAASQLPPLATIDPGHRMAASSLTWHVEQGAQSCVVCGTAVSLEVLKARHAKVAEQLAAVELNERRHRNAADKISSAKFDVQIAAQEIARYDAEVQTYSAYTAPVPSDEPEPVTLDAARQVLAAEEETLRRLEAAESSWTGAKRAREMSKDAERAADQWKDLAEECARVVTSLLDSGIAAFADKVQAFLPQSDRFALQLHDGAREACEFGLLRGGALHTALSGAEWARVTAALAAVCAPAERFSLIIPEDRAFDPQTLTEVLEALGHVNQQVVIASPVRPKKTPAGWTVVDVEAEDEVTAIEAAVVPAPMKTLVEETLEDATGPNLIDLFGGG